MVRARMAVVPLRPLRVLFLNDTARNGGPARSLHTILAHLDPKEVYRAVVLPRPGVVSDLLADVSETVVYLPDFVENPVEPVGLFARRAMRREDLDAPLPLRVARASGNVVKMGRGLTSLSRLVRRGEMDLIYCNGTTADFAGAAVGVMTGTPVLWHVRYTHVPEATRGLHDRLARTDTVRRIVCVSKAAAKLFPEVPDKVAVVHNAIDSKALSPEAVSRGVARAELGIPKEAFILGAHGRVLPRKGFIEMLRAVARARGEMSEAERARVYVVVVGDTPEDIGSDHVAECKEEARRLGLESQTRFTGFKADVRPYVRDFDVEVVPSVYEDPFPRAAIEAMAFGVPVIGADVGGIGELLEGGGGTLVPAADEQALASAILHYLRDDRARQADGARGRERAERELDARPHAERIEQENPAGGVRVKGWRAVVGRVVDVSGQRPLPVLAAALVVLFSLWGYAYTHFELHTDLLELLPKSSPGIRAFEHQLGRVGGGFSLVVVVESPDKKKNEELIDAIDTDLERLAKARPDLISYIEAGTKDVHRFFDKNKWLYADCRTS